MNNYREQQSRQRDRSGLRSLASRGSTSVQSVNPSAIDKMGKSRSSELSSSQRISVQPSVCAVQPGRLLELRTTLGLMRARAMLEQQIEQERQQQMIDEGLKGGGSVEQKQLVTKGHLKHGRLQPLGLVSDPLMISNSCLGIVAVNSHSQSPKHQRPRSYTVPGVHLGNPGPASGDNGRNESLGKRDKVRKRSYSAAVLPHNVSVDQMRELTANLSITNQTGLIPEEGTMTNTPTESIETTKANSHTGKNQTQLTTSQNNTFQLDTKGGQKSSNQDHDVQTLDTLTDKIQVLPPVVRQGELGMKVEVKRLRTHRDSSSLETSNATLIVDDKQQTGTVANSRGAKRLPKLQEKEKKQAEKLSHVSSQSPETKQKPNDDPTAQTLCDTASSPSLRKVSIVSLGETPSKSQQTDRHRKRRKRRHSEGRQVVGGGRLSQGWSSPQLGTIEPVVGSPLHTPRKQSRSQTAQQGNSHAVHGGTGTGEQGSLLDVEAIRSQMTSPGMFISVDVNEFLQDIGYQ